MKRRIALLGSTGIVGKKTLEVIDHLQEEVEIALLGAKKEHDLLFLQSLQYRPKELFLFDPKAAQKLKNQGASVRVLSNQGEISLETIDLLLIATTGIELLPFIVRAIQEKKTIAFANKELFVSAGPFLMKLAKEYGAQLLPVDSEHVAIHQALRAGRKEEVRRLILTASGGPFWNLSLDRLATICLKDCLTHPNWTMGKKVMVDCANLMNKGLEMIFASTFFEIEPEKIEAVIHPESQVHSFVEFQDGSILSQMAKPDMRLPIQYALSYPNRLQGMTPPYPFHHPFSLHFYPPDLRKFPCLALSKHCLKEGRSYPCFLNAANEVLVERFLREEIAFHQIFEKLEKLISSHKGQSMLSLEAILSVDQLARESAIKA